jgi:hypothetical protein
MTKDAVSLKLKSIMDARNDRIMERLVAKPLRMLSEYLITTRGDEPAKDLNRHSGPRPATKVVEQVGKEAMGVRDRGSCTGRGRAPELEEKSDN